MPERARNGDDGFTIVELLVVVGVLGILLTIALPTFLGQVQHAQDAAAQSLLRNALTVQRSYQVDNGVFTTNKASLQSYEAALQWNQRRNPAGTVRVRLRNSHRENEVCLYTISESGTWFAIYHGPTGTRYGEPGRVRGCNPSVARNWSLAGW